MTRTSCVWIRHKGVLLRVINRVNMKINVQIRPVKMVWMGPFHVHDRLDRGVPEPREELKGQEPLAVVQEKPYPVRSNADDLSG